MTETKLLPCPFCGGEATLYEQILEGWFCCCTKCGVRYVRMTEAEAVESWNKRTPITKDDILNSLDQTAEYLKTIPIDELRDKILKVNAEIEKWGKPLKTLKNKGK